MVIEKINVPKLIKSVLLDKSNGTYQGKIYVDKSAQKTNGYQLSKALISEMKSTEVLVNLASNEYSKVLKLNDFPNPVITPIFKDYKNGKLKVISFYAKRARGEMCNFIIKNKITNIENLKMFSDLDYKFSDENDKGEILFTR